MKEIDKNELELLRKKAENNVKEIVSNKKRRKNKKETVEDTETVINKNYNFKIDEDIKEEKNIIDEKQIDEQEKKGKKDKKIKKEKQPKIKKEKIKKEKKKKEPKIKKEKVKKEKKKKVKEPFNAKKFFFKLITCIVIATFLTIILFYFLDNFIYNLNNVNLLNEPITGLQTDKNINTGIVITEDMSSVQYSYNNKYYTYLNGGKVFVKGIKDNSEVAVISNDSEICYYHLLYDKNLVYYVTRRDSTYSTTLQIWTYEISSGKTSEFNEFNVSGFVRVKDIEYSPLVNIIYLNVERNSGGSTTNTVYRMDLFNNMSRYATNRIVNKMVMLKQEDALYFEDGDGIIFYRGYMLSIFKESVDLIGVDLNDKVYFISADRTKIYVVKNRKILNTIQLQDTNMVTWYSDNTNVYLIYPEYVINISSEVDPFKKVGKMSKYMTFQCIKSDTMYLLSRDNRVILIKLDV